MCETQPHSTINTKVSQRVFFFFLNEKGVLWAQRAFGEESMVQPSGLGQRKEMELPPSLGLRTIYIASLRGRTNLTTRVWVRSLGHG